MADYVRVLMYPILAWVLIDSMQTFDSLVFPAINNIASSGATFLGVVGIGVWVGYKMIEFKGTMVNVIVAGVIIGAVCGVVDYTETFVTGSFVGTFNPFDELPFSVLVFLYNLFGAFIGGTLKKAASGSS